LVAMILVATLFDAMSISKGALRCPYPMA